MTPNRKPGMTTPRIKKSDWQDADASELPMFAPWMMALTEQGLHDKSDIAVVLALYETALSAAESEVAEWKESFRKQEEIAFHWKKLSETEHARLESAELRASQAEEENVRLKELNKVAMAQKHDSRLYQELTAKFSFIGGAHPFSCICPLCQYDRRALSDQPKEG